jgi:signal transduction histidine kinase
MRLWEARVRERVPPASRESHPVLIDTLPAFLDHLVEALSPEHPRWLATEGSTVAQEHGGERVRLTAFRLSDLIREYQLLRDVLFEVLDEPGNALSPEERRVLTLSLDTAMSEACTAYTLVSEGIRERMMATLAHDLRGPLSAAKMGVALILRRPGDAAVPRWAARVDENLDRVDKLLRTLLDVSRAGTGAKLSLELAPSELVGLVREVVEMLRLTHGDRFVVEAPPEVRGHWNADALSRTIENLITNALKYGDPRRPIAIRIRPAHATVTLSVHNEGSYIAPEDQETIFEAFRRSHDAEHSQVRGWGLGLALVRAVAEAHGGSVGVDSLPEAGTTFTVTLPVDARRGGTAPEGADGA